jgi:hypothetical protein
MRIRHVLAPFLLTAMLAWVAAVPAGADNPPPAGSGAMSAAAPVVHGSQLIKVQDCNPKLNVSQSGGFVGYAPGWGYRGGYYGDVYGARYYQPAVTTTDPQLGIHYTNISSRPMTSIEFGLIANGHLVAEVRDVGTFSPGAEIKHKFGISPNVFPLQTGLPQCVPLRITFADGTKWRNPRLPPKNQGIGTHP